MQWLIKCKAAAKPFPLGVPTPDTSDATTPELETKFEIAV